MNLPVWLWLFVPLFLAVFFLRHWLSVAQSRFDVHGPVDWVVIAALALAGYALWQAASSIPRPQLSVQSVLAKAHDPLDDYHGVTCAVQGTDTVVYTGPAQNAPQPCYSPAVPQAATQPQPQWAANAEAADRQAGCAAQWWNSAADCQRAERLRQCLTTQHRSWPDCKRAEGLSGPG